MLQPKPNIGELVPVVHGGVNYSEIEKSGIPPEDFLDFSVSTSPFGPPPGIKKALSLAAIDRYPDSESRELKLSLARKLKIRPENLIIGSGSTELIRLVATAYLGNGDKALIPQPTYGEYEIACRIAGASVTRLKLNEKAGFRLDLPEIEEAIRQNHPRVIFLCNPNNPTGQYLSRDDIGRILAAAPECLIVLDEAYIAFTEDAWSSLDYISHYNLVIIRSMTKDYALAGLRLGYAVAPEFIISVLNSIKSPWNVSSIAQAAGILALQAEGYLDSCWSKIKEAREFLVEELEKLGLQPIPSQANFFLVKVSDAAGLRQALLRKGILVRDCASFGLPAYIRLAPRTIPECRKLIAELKEVLD